MAPSEAAAACNYPDLGRALQARAQRYEAVRARAAYGMPADLEFLTEGGGLDPATTCRVLHALIKQRQRDMERGKEAAERLARMGHDLRVRDQQREKLLAKMAAKERELGALENKVRAGPGWGWQQAWNANAKIELHQKMRLAQ